MRVSGIIIPSVETPDIPKPRRSSGTFQGAATTAVAILRQYEEAGAGMTHDQVVELRDAVERVIAPA